MKKGGMTAMRVLMITSVFPRFAGDATPSFVFNQAKALVENGWEVAVLAPHGAGAGWKDSIDGLNVFRYPYVWPFSLEKLCYEGGILVNLQLRPWTRILLPLLIAAQMLAIVLVVLKWKPNILHSHSILPQGFTTGLVNLILCRKHIVTSHGNDVFGLAPNGCMGAFKRWVLGRADAVTVNSLATRAAVLDLGVDESKIHLIPATPNPCQVNQELAAKIRREWVKDANPVLVFAGRLIKEKGVGDLLRAIAFLRSRFPAIFCLVIGDGPERPRFEALSQELGIADHCFWAGWIPPDEVASWMAAGDLLVVPSRNGGSGWKEAQGLVVVEAMLAGVPVIASRLGGLPDMVEDGVTGRLFEPGNPAMLASLLEEIFADCSILQSLAREAALRAAVRFSTPAVTSLAAQLYRTLSTTE